MTHGEFTKHVAVNPSPPSALLSPVTEVILTYFPSDVSTATKDAATAKLEDFAAKSRESCSDIQAVSHGWGVETDFPIRGGEKGQVGAIQVAFIGWTSIEAHMKFRETDLFKENVQSIRSMEGMLSRTVFHVSCQNMARK